MISNWHAYPIFKNGSKSDRNNYRPISVLSVVAKVFEMSILKQLSTYLESNKLLSKSHCQSGFRKNNSTETSLLNTTNTWYINMAKGYTLMDYILRIKESL